VWHELTPGYACFMRAMGVCFCQVYQLNAHVWRWEVLRWRDPAARFDLERAGTQSALSQAIAAAEGYVEASQKPTPS
jgi:hypothetical protein